MGENKITTMLNYVNISKRKDKYNTYNFTFKNDFFENYFAFEVDDEKVIFKRVGIDYEGKYYKASHSHYGWYTFQCVNENIKEGSFYFDEEESNEDIIIAYFEDERIKD